MRAVIVALVVFIVPWSGQAVEMSTPVENDSYYNLLLTGNVEVGDYERLVVFIKQKGAFPSTVLLNSRGGSVMDALKMGRLFRKAYLRVWAVNECHSACFLMWVGGAERDEAGAIIGLHRPYYDEVYFSGLSVTDADSKYKELDRMVNQYMEEMGVPTTLRERIMSVRSTGAQPMSGEDVVRIVGTRPPSYEEWMLAKCEELSVSENADFEAVRGLDNFVSGKEMLDKRLGDKALFTAFVEANAERAKYALSLSEGYRDYLRQKHRQMVKCEYDAIKGTRDKVFSELR